MTKRQEGGLRNAKKTPPITRARKTRNDLDEEGGAITQKEEKLRGGKTPGHDEGQQE